MVPSQRPASLEAVLDGAQPASVYDARVLDEAYFYAGSLLDNRQYWADVAIPLHSDHRKYALATLGNISAATVFRPWSGTYNGVAYVDQPRPPARVFHNYGLHGVTVSTGQSAASWLAAHYTKRLQKGLCRKWGSCISDLLIGARPRVVNPLTVEPVKPRAITAMCFVNCWTDSPHFFEGLLNYVTQVPGSFGRHPYMASTDFKAQYDHYTLHDDLQPNFGFCLDLEDGNGPQDFVHTAGGFGFRPYPYIANVHRYLKDNYIRSKGCRILGFFDDCLKGGRDRPRAAACSDLQLRQQFGVGPAVSAQLLMAHECQYIDLEVSTLCGYFFSQSKSNWVPSPFETWVGTCLDGRQELYVTQEAKVLKFKAMCRECLIAVDVDWYFYDRLAGRAQSLAVSCRAMVVHSKYFYARIKQHRAENSDMSSRIAVRHMERRICSLFLSLPPGAFTHPWLNHMHDIATVSDANDIRWSFMLSLTSPLHHKELFRQANQAAALVSSSTPHEDIVQMHSLHIPQDLVASGEMPVHLLSRGIGFKELYAVVFGLIALIQQHGPQIVYGRRLRPWLDNEGDVGIIRKGGSTTVELNELMELLFWLQVFYKFDVGIPTWLSTKDNFVMDAYTRIPAHVDAHLSDALFEFLDLTWGPFVVDLMATSASAKCPAFYSRFACPGAAAVDVLTQDLSVGLAYGFPAPAFTGAVLTHLERCKGQAALVLPAGTHVWTPLVVGAQVSRIEILAPFLPFAFGSSRVGLRACGFYTSIA